MSPAAVYLLGMIGAIAPEVIRLYSIRERPDQFKWSWFYLLVSLCFAALGGVLALVFPATTYWGALYIGVSTPILVNQLVRKGRSLLKPQLKGQSSVATKYSAFDSFILGL